MNKRKTVPGMKVWDILYPLLLYYAVTVIIMFLASLIVGSSTENYMIRQIIVAVITLPIMYAEFYRPDQKVWNFPAPVFGTKAPEQQSNRGETAGTALMIFLIAVLIGTGLNNLILMSPLAEASAGFAEANAGFYGSVLAVELIGSGLLTPILEETVYRGILFGRIKRTGVGRWAVPVSALIFAFMHFNVVQALYAFVLGLVFALLVEKKQVLWVSALAHIAVNCLAVLRTELNWFGFMLDGSAFAWIFAVICCIAGAGLLYIELKR